MTTDQKFQRLTAISNQRNELHDKAAQRKEKNAAIINRGSRRKGKTIAKVAVAIMSGGISLISDAINVVMSKDERKLFSDKVDSFEVEDDIA